MRRVCTRRVRGFVYLVAPLVINPFTVQAYGPEHLGPRAFVPMAALCAASFAYGLHLLSFNKWPRRVAFALLLCAALGSMADRLLPEPLFPRGSDEQRVLARAMELERAGFAQVGQVTSEILYRVGERQAVRSFSLAGLEHREGLVIETAAGVDSLLGEGFEGILVFQVDVEIQGQGGKLLPVASTAIDLASHPLEWKPLSAELPPLEGEAVALHFTKTYQADDARPLGYDLTPTDLAFWRRPVVRPRHLPNRPNVLLISLDTLRADHLHYAGYSRATSPNLDQIASRGTVFTNVVSQAPWTTPAHFSLLTGTYPAIHGGNQPISMRTRRLQSRVDMIQSLLRDRGYATAAFTGSGSISARFGFFQGFDFYDETRGTPPCRSDIEAVVSKSSDWLRKNAERSFFMFVHTYEPHAPYCGKEFVEREGISEDETIALRTALYDGDILRTDHFVGKLFDLLEELDLVEETLVIITSDHGEDLGGRNPPQAALQFGHGYSLYDELLMVPLILVGPTVPRGRRVTQQVRLIDVAPTIAALTGLEAHEVFEGAPLQPFFQSEDEPDRPAYSEATTYGTERESLRHDGFKYVHRLGYGQLALPDSFGLPLTPLYELYDLREDPGERHNVADASPSRLEELQQILAQTRTGGPEPQPVTRPETTIRLDEDTELMEQLKALGYVQ